MRTSLALRLALALVCASFAGTRAPALDLTGALDRLSAPSAAERWSAEREIAISATPLDYAQLASRANAGDAEVRTRLARALGSHERHLELVALFLVERAPPLVQVGELALSDLLEAWLPDLDQPALSGADLSQRVAQLADAAGGGRVRVQLRGELASALDRLARFGPLPLEIALEPGCEGARFESGAERSAVQAVEGTWDEVLAGLVARARLAVDAPVTWPLHGEGARIFVRVHAGRTQERGTPAQRVRAWVQAFAQPGDEAQRTRAARALAGSGWPAAIAWFERRWLEQRDPAALAGLVLAAGRGRVAPALATRASVLALIEAIELEARAGDAAAMERAHALRRALERVGPWATDGSELGALLVQGADPRAGFASWWRLCVLRAWRSPAPAAREYALAALAAPPGAAPPAALAAALRAVVALPPRIADGAWRTPVAELRDWNGLVAAARDAAEARELGALLARAGVRAEPSEFEARLAGSQSANATSSLVLSALCSWMLASGEPAFAARALALLEPALAHELAAELARSGERERALGLFAHAREQGLDAARLARLELASGCLPEAQHAALLERARTRVEGGESEHETLALLSAGPVGEAARAELVAALVRARQAGVGDDPEPLAAALCTALGTLHAAGLDDEARVFVLRCNAQLRNAAGARLLRALERRAWPHPRGPSVRDLDRLDPSW